MKKILNIKYITLFLITLTILAAIIFRSKLPNVVDIVFEPVSVVTKVVADAELQSTDGRTNILILGTDRRVAGANVSPGLTDTIMVVSIDKEGRKPVLISIPRDVWVSIEGRGSKINAVYVLTYQANLTNLLNQNIPREEAAEQASSIAMNAIKGEIENIMGIRIHYYGLIGFTAFTDAIDAIGGVEVNVPRSFTDYKYPVEGREDDLCGMSVEEFELLMAPPEIDEDSEEEADAEAVEIEIAPPEVLFPCRYETISFTQGITSMNGETALKFARSRHSLQDGGDFNRARRQQAVVDAVRSKVFSAGTLFNPVRIKDLYESYKNNVKTNVALSDAILFYDIYRDANVGKIEQIILSDDVNGDYIGAGTLFTPPASERGSYGGQYVLLPVSRTYDQIRTIIREVLFTYNDVPEISNSD